MLGSTLLVFISLGTDKYYRTRGLLEGAMPLGAPQLLMVLPCPTYTLVLVVGLKF